jgi:hypothetical protein
MKKAFFLILIVFLFSCKEEPICWQCEITSSTTSRVRAYPMTNISLTKCGLSEKEIKAYEKANNTITLMNSDGVNWGITWLKCECKKQ